MSEIHELTGPERAPAQGGMPDRLIIFLHGLGADGNDLIGLGAILGQVFPKAHFAAPDAPFPCDMAPMGRQWFSLQNLDRKVLEEGAEGVTDTINAFIDDQQTKHGMTSDRVAVIGFSQGTMLALHALPRRPEPLAGLVGFSGMLVSPESLAEKGVTRTPCLLLHGDQDEVVPPEMTTYAGQALQLAGFDVQAATLGGLGHSIDERGLQLAVEFLARAFGDINPEDAAGLPEEAPGDESGGDEPGEDTPNAAEQPGKEEEPN